MTPEAIIRLEHAIEHDLDEPIGGIRWWATHLDGIPRVTQADYLVTSVRGVRFALRAANHESARHREAIEADAAWAREWWDANGLNTAPQRDMPARRRELDVQNSYEATVVHLGQALDRLAAAIVLVAGLPENARTVHWGTIHTRALALARSTATGPAHDLQVRAVEGVLDLDAHGPKDWLPWLRGTRNTYVHRAVRDQMLVLTGDADKGDNRIVRAAYRQPEFHTVEAIGPSMARPAETFIIQDSEKLLGGLVHSTESLVRTVVAALLEVWLARRADPDLIPQPDEAWPARKREPALKFDGYGSGVPWKAGDVIDLHARDRVRFEAAGLMIGQRPHWRSNMPGQTGADPQ
jgi:hypothetical protein